MNSRINEPRGRIFEKEIKYGSAIKGMSDSIIDGTCCLISDTPHRVKPYLR